MSDALDDEDFPSWVITNLPDKLNPNQPTHHLYPNADGTPGPPHLASQIASDLVQGQPPPHHVGTNHYSATGGTHTQESDTPFMLGHSISSAMTMDTQLSMVEASLPDNTMVVSDLRSSMATIEHCLRGLQPCTGMQTASSSTTLSLLSSARQSGSLTLPTNQSSLSEEIEGNRD
eukprot:202160-Ditylum_brightwellii.AAC.1